VAQVVLVVELAIKPQHFEQFIEIAREHGKRSRKLESGCLRFEVLKPRASIESPDPSQNRLILIEAYVDDAALEHHWNSPHMAAYRERVQGMIQERRAHRCAIL
jgi:quinol monooxygenase YgiN